MLAVGWSGGFWIHTVVGLTGCPGDGTWVGTHIENHAKYFCMRNRETAKCYFCGKAGAGAEDGGGLLQMCEIRGAFEPGQENEWVNGLLAAGALVLEVCA